MVDIAFYNTSKTFVQVQEVNNYTALNISALLLSFNSQMSNTINGRHHCSARVLARSNNDDYFSEIFNTSFFNENTK